MLDATLTVEYVPGMTLVDYRRLVRENFPALAAKLRLERSDIHAEIEKLTSLNNEFEKDGDAGRGDSYRRAQRDFAVRMSGIRQLTSMAAGVAALEHIPHGWCVLDVLGGDGTMAKALHSALPGAAIEVITGDLAGHMIAEALGSGLPAVRQRAQRLLLGDATVDAVIVAYGSHHIPVADRTNVCREAYRVLKSSGTLVFHDFAEDSATAGWFSEVVDRYSAAGHKYDHFTDEGLREHLEGASFEAVGIHQVYDPFTISAATEAEARQKLAIYIFDMYGLTGLATPGMAEKEIADRVWRLACEHFVLDFSDGIEPDWVKEPTVCFDQETGSWTAEIPRLATVAVGRKLG